jgi:hypothetical protein
LERFQNFKLFVKDFRSPREGQVLGGAEQAEFDGMLHMKTSGELFKVCMEKIVIFQHVFKIEKMSSEISWKIGIFLSSGDFLLPQS